MRVAQNVFFDLEQIVLLASFLCTCTLKNRGKTSTPEQKMAFRRGRSKDFHSVHRGHGMLF